LVEKRPQLLEFADAEIVEALSYHLRDGSRCTMRLNEEVESVEESLRAAWLQSAKQEKISDALLYAVGRSGNVDELNLKPPASPRFARPHRRRRQFSHQPAAHFAAGDVIRFPSLASVSMEQAVLPPRRLLASTRIPIQPRIRMVFTPFPRFRLSGKLKSSLPTRIFHTKSAWPTIARLRAARSAAILRAG
jgi:NAD(P) transhydrogenase